MPIGKYQGRALVELLNDGRLVKLEKPFAYIDPGRTRWQVPKNAVVDGASIPRMLWPLLGGPFEGKYRNASIIHDWYCDIRVRPWKQVHRMFYDAMITSLVSPKKAKLLYAGVYMGGPRWSKTAVENTRLVTGYRLPTAYRSAHSGRKAAAKKSSTHKLRTTKTVTVLHKYRMTDADFGWLNDQIQDPSQSLASIESMVNNRLASRTPRKLKA
jgi:Protein of unknown function (DUF1353)